MEVRCPNCEEMMCQDNPGVDCTDKHFTLDYSCDCGTSAQISFDADEEVEIIDAKGETSYVDINDMV